MQLNQDSKALEGFRLMRPLLKTPKLLWLELSKSEIVFMEVFFYAGKWYVRVAEP